MRQDLKFWGTFLKYGSRAAGAIFREFVGTSSNLSMAEIKGNSLGPVNISYRDGKIYGTNPLKDTIVITCASTDNQGKAKQSSEIILRGEEEEKDITNALKDNASGVVSWRRLDSNGVYQENNDSGGMIVSVNNWAYGALTLGDKDLNLVVDTESNKFHLQAIEHSYTNISINVVERDGSIYHFGYFDLRSGKQVSIQYPGTMDDELPLSSITFKANCSEELYNAMLMARK